MGLKSLPQKPLVTGFEDHVKLCIYTSQMKPGSPGEMTSIEPWAFLFVKVPKDSIWGRPLIYCLETAVTREDLWPRRLDKARGVDCYSFRC